jgi:proteasome lid subunit RPN8/RPN11
MNINDYKKNNRFKESVWDSGIEFVSCSKVPNDFTINLSVTVKAKIDALMKEYPNIEWLCYLIGNINWNSNIANITDLFIPEKQKISATLVDDIEYTHRTDIIGVIHSHHNMPAQFSGTDNEYINKNNDLSIVVSHKEMNSVVRYKTPCGSFTFIEPTIKIDYSTVCDVESFINEAKEKIKKPVNINNPFDFEDDETDFECLDILDIDDYEYEDEDIYQDFRRCGVI